MSTTNKNPLTAMQENIMEAKRMLSGLNVPASQENATRLYLCYQYLSNLREIAAALANAAKQETNQEEKGEKEC